MKQNIFLIFFLICAILPIKAVTNAELKMFNETTKDWIPTEFFNMNYALFDVGRDSQCLVSNKGKIILKLSKDERISFNSADVDFRTDFGININGRADFNLDKAYPIIVQNINDDSLYIVDCNGKVIAEKGVYDHACVFIDGYLRVCKNGLWGVVDTDMKIIIPFKHAEYGEIFINHNIWTYSYDDKKWHMHDATGKEICSYDFVDRNVYKRMAMVEKNYRRYLRNRSLGITIVRNGDKWGAVDKNGKVVIPLVNNEQCSVYTDSNGLWYYDESIFDQSGKLLYKPGDYHTTAYTAFGYIFTERNEVRNDKYFCDFAIFEKSTGTKISYFPIDEDRRWHLLGNEWVLEDKNGKYISGPYIDLQFKQDCTSKDWAPWYGYDSDKYFEVVDDGKAGLIDQNGKFILPMKYSSCSVDHSVLRGSILDGSIRYVAFYDFNGKEIQPMALHKRLAHENFGWHYEGTDCTLDAYQVNGKWGLLDMETKKTVVPFCLDDVLAFMHGVGVVKYKGRLYYINEKGEGLPNEAYMTK